MSDIIEVSNEFIEESKLDRTRQKKGGPYSKKDRHVRRQEVYRLHFEYGYSSVKISELMKINRHTIDDDIKLGYSKLTKTMDESDTDSLIMKQILRMEGQRTRLLEQLEKTESLESKLSIEKMIMDSDNRLASMYLKFRDAEKIIVEEAMDVLDQWLEELGLDVKVMRRDAIMKLSKPTYDKIKKLIKDDKLPWNWQGNHKAKKH